jgi:tetratricopeptide (TPR) repeat protein
MNNASALCISICLFVVSLFNVQAQTFPLKDQVIIKGRILNSKTQQPVSFANIGFFRREIGTVSDEQGNFELQFNTKDIETGDILQVSILGFQTMKIDVGDLDILRTSSNPVLYITPISYGLEEIVLDGKKKRSITIGNPKPSPARFGYWKNKKGLGGEIATRIKISKKDTKLENLHFIILANMSDSLLVRVNVYDIHPGYFEPRDNLLKQAIYHTIKRRNGKETIPLSDYNIQVDDDVIVGIELVKIYGERIGFAVSASANKKSSYLRGSSHGYWQKFKGQAMAFTLDVSYPSDNDKEVTRRIKPQEVVVYWDASAKANSDPLSGSKRDITKELALLARYLNSLKTVDVTVHKFAFGFHETKIFKLRKASSDVVIDYLEDTNYEGETDYRALKEQVSKRSKNILVFSDGNSFTSSLSPVFNSPTFTISSSALANTEALEELSLYTDGAHLALDEMSTKDAYTLLIKDLELKQKSTVQRTSIVGMLNSPLTSQEGIKIFNTKTKTHVVADADGKFNILGQMGDQLLIKYPGLQTKRLTLGAQETVEVTLVPEGDWLNEVVITGEGKKELIETSVGKKDFNAVTTKSKVITDTDIKTQHLTLKDVLNDDPQIDIKIHPFNGQVQYVIQRTFNMSINTPQLPIIVIDGQIYEQNPLSLSDISVTGAPRLANDIPPIDPQTISSIVVTASLSATTLYGAKGAGGAIIIKTKSYDPKYSGAPKEPINRALVQGNEYVDVAKSLDEILDSAPYHSQLERATNYEEVNDIYTYYLNSAFSNSPSFYIDVSRYFRKFNRNKALRVLSNVTAMAPYSIANLQLFAYELEDRKELELATKAYQQLLQLAPDRIQSYRDLALAYQNTGAYDKAFTIYKQMLANDTKGLDFSPLKKTIEFELMHLLAFHKSEVRFQDLPSSLLDVSFKKDRRLVFEWTNVDADFEIQFVNPQGKYFSWSHDKVQTMDRIQSEFRHGYTMEEFALDDAPPGEWLVNVQYFEGAIEVPVYLKYTLFLNYATPEETKMTKIIKLFEQTDKVTLGKITLQE